MEQQLDALGIIGVLHAKKKRGLYPYVASSYALPRILYRNNESDGLLKPKLDISAKRWVTNDTRIKRKESRCVILAFSGAPLYGRSSCGSSSQHGTSSSLRDALTLETA